MRSLVVVVFFGMAIFATAKKDSCREFIVDQCTEDNSGLIEVLHNLEIDDCQFFCGTVYSNCKFFTYDNKQGLCSLFSIKMVDYWATCSKHGGPSKPDIGNCTQIVSGDPCEVVYFLLLPPRQIKYPVDSDDELKIEDVRYDDMT